MNGNDAVAILPCIFMLLFLLFGLSILVTCLIALIHAATHKMENQAVWILVIVIGGPIGALAYFIAGPYRN